MALGLLVEISREGAAAYKGQVVDNAMGLSRNGPGWSVADSSDRRQFGKTCPRIFTYNGDGLRTRQTLGWFGSEYVWDQAAGLPVVLEETNREELNRASENAVYRTRSKFTYVYGLGLISSTDDQGNQRYYFSDALGSTTAALDGTSGAVTGTHSYDVFGNRRLQTGQPTIPPEIFLFAGQQFDPKARADAGGLYYLRARFFDPSIGRFLTPDPLQGSTLDPQSLNRYSYVQNNPVNRVDPTGLLSEGRPFGETLLLIFECLEVSGATLALLALFGLFLVLPLFVASLGVPGLLLTAIALESGIAALAALTAFFGVGYTAYQLCSETVD